MIESLVGCSQFFRSEVLSGEISNKYLYFQTKKKANGDKEAGDNGSKGNLLCVTDNKHFDM